MTAQRRPHGRYIPALDGIRTLAVAAVVLYHLNPTLIPGGMQGVTVFFVLSGYLITSLLLGEFKTTTRIDLKAFWIRRLRRLVPATVAVVVGAAALCTMFNHVMLTKMRGDIVPSLLYLNNWWQIFNNVSYFNNVGDPSPLTHFWSLAIEAQFYLIWPVLLLFALKSKQPRKRIRRAVLALAALSALEMALLYNPAVDPSRVYYGTDTRAFSLLLGAWLAFIPLESLPKKLFGAKSLAASRVKGRADTRRAETPTPSAALFDALGVIGLVGTVALMVLTNGYTPFPYRGGILLASVFALLLVASCAAPESHVAKLFEVKPLVWLGQRSYSMYLWHFPLLALMNPVTDVSVKPWWVHAVQIALVIAISAACYRLIETPFRRGALGKLAARVRAGHAKVFPLLKRQALPLAACLAVGAVALYGIVAIPSTSALSKEGAAMLQGGTDASEDEGASEGTANKPAPKQDKSAKAADGTKLNASGFPEGSYDITMIGDSVSLRAVEPFQQTFAHGTIDAKKNRQFTAGIEIYRGLLEQNLCGRVAVFALGTNGLVTDENIDEVMGLAGEDRIVFFVNNRCPTAAWISANNDTFKRAAERYKNVRVIDWHGYSANRNDLFDGDGTHLTLEGAEEYVQLVKDSVRNYLPPHLEDNDDPRLLAVQEMLTAFQKALTAL